MRVSELGGEQGLIERIRERYAAAAGRGLVIPVGDDAAVLDVPAGSQIVVSTDMLVERVHFRRDWSDPAAIGWKAAAVNLSDMAAMGAVPTAAFLSIAFAAQETVENLDLMLGGFVDCLGHDGAWLAGGDTNAAPDSLVLSVTQVGQVDAGRAWTRAGARQGDMLLVTGTLGGSAMGLALLTEYGRDRAEKVGTALVEAHRRPRPRVRAALAAAATGKVRAAMDLSDGLVGDLQKLCAASGVGARIETAALSLSDDLRQAADLLHRDPLAVALEGGEDYELLLAVAPEDVAAVQAAVQAAGTPLTCIGQTLKTGLQIVAPNGQDELPIPGRGWDHFVQ